MYNSKSSFYWQSDLTDERKEAIIKWVKSLGKEEKEYLDNIISDTWEEAKYGG